MSIGILRTLKRLGIRRIVDSIILTFIRDVDGSLGFLLRYHYYKKKFKYIGKDVRIDTSVYFHGCEYMTIGDDVYIDKFSILEASSPDLDLSYRIMKTVADGSINVNKGELVIGNHVHLCQNSMIFAYGGIKIGNKCTMSAGSKLYSLSSLPYNPFNKSEVVSIMPYSDKSPSIIGKIELEENVWLGLHVVVFPGVKIGKNSFIRSNAVVLESCQENSFLSGDPAQRIKKRYDY